MSGEPGDPHPELPLDSDPAHLRPGLIGLVFVGGAAGSLLRWAVGLGVPRLGGLPLGTLTVNMLGAFVLGLLLETLARRGPDRGVRRALRVTLGTGFCGGFTTYSALSVEAGGLLRAGSVGPALAYSLGTVVLGLVAAAAGVALGARMGGSRS